MENNIIRAEFIKWHPSVKIKELPNLRLQEVLEFEDRKDINGIINILVSLGYYVAQHYDAKENLITIAIDTCWFRTR